VRVEGTARARSIHKTQADAAKVGSAIARKNKSELLIHSRDGKIREAQHLRPRPAADEGLARDSLRFSPATEDPFRRLTRERSDTQTG
jgi:hypothetical protein